MPKDPRFATEAGNAAFTNYEGTVVETYFAPGTFGVQLNMVVGLTHPELHPLIQGGSQTVRLGVGGKWETLDGGKTIVHPEGPKADGGVRAIGAGTEYGVLLKKQIEQDGLGNVDGFMASIAADWDPHVAKSWQGLTFRFDDVEYETRTVLKNADGTDQVDDAGKTVWGPGTKTRVMPVEFIGVKGQTNGRVDVMTVGELNLADGDSAFVLALLEQGLSYDAAVSQMLSAGKFNELNPKIPDKETWAALVTGSKSEF